MQRYLLASVIQAALVLAVVLVLVFFMVHITGDPAALMMAREASAEQVQAFRHAMGFDRPLLVQFLEYASRMARGDFGESLHYGVPALPLILERLPATVQLATVALLMSLCTAVPLGLISGSSPGSRWDVVARAVGLIGQTTPSYWLAMVLIIVFAVHAGWFPTFGRTGVTSVVLPAFALSLATTGYLVRLTRATVLEVRGEDYVRTAHSKGLSREGVYLRH